jgi:cysteine desulfurase family protein (TIGR01976 family)
LAAERAGAIVRWAEFDTATGELAPEAFDDVISDRTRLVAFTAASNVIGTKPDVRAISERAHAAGAFTYVDGVHAACHGPVDVASLGADFYVCSTYKLFAPHAGAIVAAPEMLRRFTPPKLKPSPDGVPERFERGTLPFEALAGVTAAIDWIAGLAATGETRRAKIENAFDAIEQHLHKLLQRTLDGLASIPRIDVLGRAKRRASTVSFVVDGHSPREVAQKLAARGISVWNGDNYAYELMERYGLGESGGAIRASIVLYNDADDIDRFLEAIADIASR